MGTQVIKGAPVSMKRSMYGDLTNSLVYSVFLPVYVYMALISDDLKRQAAMRICCAFAITTVSGWLSYLNQSHDASVVAFVANTVSIYLMNVTGWPHPDEVIVFPQFLWSLLIASANIDLSSHVKIALGLLAAMNAVYVYATSPFADLSEVLPSIVCISLVYALFHIFSKSKDVSAHSAGILLAASFAFHITSEVMKMYTLENYHVEGGYSIIRAGFFAVVGLATANQFQQSSNLNEVLERKVQERTAEILEQAEHLRLVEHALRQSETAMAIASSGTLLWRNESFVKMCGKETDLKSIPWLMKALARGSQKSETRLKDRYLEVNISLYPAASDEVQSFIAINDITSEREREKAELLAQQEAMLAKSMNDSMQTLSHELRTPLQGIIGMSSLLLQQKLPTDIEESLSVVMASARLLLTLINNMLDVRKCQASCMDAFPLHPVSVSAGIEDAISFCQPLALTSNIKIVTEVSKDLFVQSNMLRFQQIVINLLSNAIKHSPVSTNIIVKARMHGSQEVEQMRKNAFTACDYRETKISDNSTKMVVCSITDAGHGLSSGCEDKLFSKFSQFDQAQESGGVGQPSGTGLGLNLCHEFVTRMSGYIWANNTASGGASFAFSLPVATLKATAAMAIQNIQEQAEMAVKHDLTRLRLLIVDDTLINLKVLKKMLERVGVIDIVMANDGVEALQVLEEREVDLVLTDLQMPHMTGEQLSEAIRTKASPPVVVGITADSNEALEDTCRQHGMLTCLRKPITTEKLELFLNQYYESHTISRVAAL